MALLPKDKLASRVFLVLVAFHLLLVSIQVPRGPAPSFFERGVFFIFSPVQHGLVSSFRFVRGLWTGYFNLVRVQRRNRALSEESFRLRQENSLLRQALETARPTREMISRLSARRGSILEASVISLDPVNYYKSVVIDRGRMDGLEADMVVLDRNGNLVGRVIEPISLKEASVQLITDDSSGTSVFIRGDKGIGVVTGDSRGRCLLKYILDTAEGIGPGDELVTTGFDKVYPWGIPVGRITSVRSNKTLFKEVRVAPYFHFRDLGRVAVLRVGRNP